MATPAEGGREPELRTGRMARLLAPPRGSRVLLAGEAEACSPPACPPCRRRKSPGGNRIGDGKRAERLPYPDASFDRLGAQFTLEYVEDPAPVMREWARVLEEGGRLAVVVRNPLFRTADRWPRAPPRRSRFTPKDLERMARDAGLRVESVSTLVPDLRLPLFYRDDLTFSLRFEGLPWFRAHGRLLSLRPSSRRGKGGKLKKALIGLDGRGLGNINRARGIGQYTTQLLKGLLEVNRDYELVLFGYGRAGGQPRRADMAAALAWRGDSQAAPYLHPHPAPGTPAGARGAGSGASLSSTPSITTCRPGCPSPRWSPCTTSSSKCCAAPTWDPPPGCGMRSHRTAARRARRVIAVSESTRRDVERVWGIPRSASR